MLYSKSTNLVFAYLDYFFHFEIMTFFCYVEFTYTQISIRNEYYPTENS